MLAATVDVAGAAQLSAVAVERRDADQRGGLAPVDGAKFGHVGAQAGGVDGAQARHRAQDRSPPCERSVGGEAGLDRGVGLLDQLVE